MPVGSHIRLILPRWLMAHGCFFLFIMMDVGKSARMRETPSPIGKTLRLKDGSGKAEMRRECVDVSAWTKDPCSRQPREFRDHASHASSLFTPKKVERRMNKSYQESFVVVDVVVVVVLRLNPHSSKEAPPKLRNAPLQGHRKPHPFCPAPVRSIDFSTAALPWIQERV